MSHSNNSPGGSRSSRHAPLSRDSERPRSEYDPSGYSGDRLGPQFAATNDPDLSRYANNDHPISYLSSAHLFVGHQSTVGCSGGSSHHSSGQWSPSGTTLIGGGSPSSNRSSQPLSNLNLSSQEVSNQEWRNSSRSMSSTDADDAFPLQIGGAARGQRITRGQYDPLITRQQRIQGLHGQHSVQTMTSEDVGTTASPGPSAPTFLIALAIRLL